MKNNILVTGSSSGFGFLTVLSLAKRGHTVFATMRDPEGKNRDAAAELRDLAETHGFSVHVLNLDVTSDSSVRNAVDSAIAKAGPLEVVVNNAGYTVAGLAETATSQQVLDEFNTNVVGMHRMNRAVLPGMRARRSGLLIHISSILGRTIFPFLGPYTVTKWAVEALAETYRYELKLSGVDVSVVQPGPFPTSLVDKRQVGSDVERAAGYGQLATGFEELSRGMEEMFKVPKAPDPQEVADSIVALVDTPAGKRPTRVVVDRFSGDGARALNDAHTQVQRALLAGIGMPFLAE